MSTQEEPKKNLCPSCGGDLKEVYAEANYGRYLLLDQCNSCGGIWFDKWELYYLKDNEANRLDPVDRDRLLAPLSSRSGPGLCPVCNIDLVPFYDPILPKDGNIKRCLGCSGLWLNRGELKRYHEHKIALKSRQKETPLPLDLPPLLTLEDHNKRLEELKNLGNALSTRVNPEIPDTITLDGPEIDRGELAKDLIFIIIQVLLRLFLKI